MHGWYTNHFPHGCRLHWEQIQVALLPEQCFTWHWFSLFWKLSDFTWICWRCSCICCFSWRFFSYSSASSSSSWNKIFLREIFSPVVSLYRIHISTVSGKMQHCKQQSNIKILTGKFSVLGIIISIRKNALKNIHNVYILYWISWLQTTNTFTTTRAKLLVSNKIFVNMYANSNITYRTEFTNTIS